MVAVDSIPIYFTIKSFFRIDCKFLLAPLKMAGAAREVTSPVKWLCLQRGGATASPIARKVVVWLTCETVTRTVGMFEYDAIPTRRVPLWGDAVACGSYAGRDVGSHWVLLTVMCPTNKANTNTERMRCIRVQLTTSGYHSTLWIH